jgi:uncharacterized DUF497 family protein
MAEHTIEFSAGKDRLNQRISLERSQEFDLDAALLQVDTSHDDAEERWIALGFLAGTLYVMVFVYLTEMTCASSVCAKPICATGPEWPQFADRILRAGLKRLKRNAA